MLCKDPITHFPIELNSKGNCNFATWNHQKYQECRQVAHSNYSISVMYGLMLSDPQTLCAYLESTIKWVGWSWLVQLEVKSCEVSLPDQRFRPPRHMMRERGRWGVSWCFWCFSRSICKQPSCLTPQHSFAVTYFGVWSKQGHTHTHSAHFDAKICMRLWMRSVFVWLRVPWKYISNLTTQISFHFYV